MCKSMTDFETLVQTIQAQKEERQPQQTDQGERGRAESLYEEEAEAGACIQVHRCNSLL